MPSSGAETAFKSSKKLRPLYDKSSSSSQYVETNKQSCPVLTQNFEHDAFQMQVGDFLNELEALRKRRRGIAESFLENIKKAIELIPEVPPFTPDLSQEYFQHSPEVAFPFAQQNLPNEINYSIEYRQPVRISLAGSFALGTALVRKKEVSSIDLIIIMPKSLFQPKDYNYHRFFHKRAFFIACVAAGLSRSKDLDLDLSYEFLHGNALQPVVLAAPHGDLNGKLEVRLIPVLESDIFVAHKTLPISNCLRPTAVVSEERFGSSPTPLYNGAVRAECNTLFYESLRHQCTKLASGYKDACILMSVWLMQRDMGSTLSEGGFGAYEASILMALLLQNGAAKKDVSLSRGYNGVQLFKATLSLLHERDFSHAPMVLGLLPSKITPASFSGLPTVWDAERSFNILYKMSDSSYAKLRYHAAIALQIFQNTQIDLFRILFLQRVTDARKVFDDWLIISGSTSHEPRQCELEGAPCGMALAREAYATLSKALGNRATQIQIIASPKRHMQKLSSPFKWPSVHIEVGLILRPQHFNRTVDRGPSADDKVAASGFRQFWEERSELRRFQDGSIIESLVWQDAERSMAVHRQVIEHVCRRKLAVQPVFKGLQPYGDKNGPIYVHDAMRRMNDIWNLFEKARNLIQSLSTMPLKLRHVSPIALHLPNSADNSEAGDVLEACIQYEGSMGWPDKIKAIGFTKAALSARMFAILERDHPELHLTFGLDETHYGDDSHFDVTSSVVKQTVRFRIVHAHETVILSDELRKATSTAQRQALSQEIVRQTNYYKSQPEHIQAIRQLSLRMPLLLPTLLLFQKWCSAHLLTNQLSTHFEELLVAYVFTTPYPYSCPSNIQTALIRVWDLIATWDWESAPLLVMLNDELPFYASKGARSHYEAWRKTLSPSSTQSSAYVISNLGSSVANVPCERPSKVALNRLIGLAKASLKALTDSRCDATTAFATGLSDFDVVISLKEEVHSVTLPKSSKSAHKNLWGQTTETSTGWSHSSAGTFIRELIHGYSDTLILFHNWGEIPVIAGLWTLRCQSKGWRVQTSISSQPVQGEKDEVEANCRAILNDISRLGFDIIERIDVRAS